MLNKRWRWFHSSRVKLTLISMSASWFLVSTHLIWIFGSKLILSNNQSRATLWVLDTCLTVGLRPLTVILMTASLFFKDTIDQHLGCSFQLVFWSWFLLHEWFPVPHQFPGASLNGLLVLFVERNTSITTSEVESRDSIHSQSTSIQRNDFWFSRAVGYCRLFLTHPTYRKQMFAFQRYIRFLPKFFFESSRSPAKIGVLKQSQPALFCSVSHMTILFVIACTMNVGDQAC